MIVHLMYYLISSLFFDISLSYYTNLYSSIICCLFSGDMYLSYCMFVSFSLAFECNIFKWLVILLTVYYQSPVASVLSWSVLFEAFIITSILDILPLSRSFWLYLLLMFLATLVACVPTFLAKDKNPYHFTYILFVSSIE